VSKFRRAAKIDSNQNDIVKSLRSIPGCTVALSHDDILVGFKGETFWYELKDSSCVSKRTGAILNSSKKKDQVKLEQSWSGHYRIVSNIDEILKDIMSPCLQCKPNCIGCIHYLVK
jgi:hypothetical protein